MKIQTDKIAIVTLTIGDFYHQMAKYTHPFMRSYAKKINADFIVLDQYLISKKYQLPTKYEKFQLYNLLEEYNRIAFIDTDIIVSPETPNIFDICPSDHFAAVSEESFAYSANEKIVTQAELGSVAWINNYFNSGFMVIPSTCRELFNPEEPGLRHWATGDFRKKYPVLLNDQPYLNHRLHILKYKYFEFDYRFNHTHSQRRSHKRFTSFLIHYSGVSGHRYGKRLDQIANDCRIFRNNSLIKLYSKLPMLRWILDRLNIYFLIYLKEERLGL